MPDWKISRLYSDVVVDDRPLSGILSFGGGKVVMRGCITVKIESIISQTFPKMAQVNANTMDERCIEGSTRRIENKNGQLQLTKFETEVLLVFVQFSAYGWLNVPEGLWY